MSRQVNSIIVIVDWSWGWSETEHVYGKQVEIVIDFHVPCPQCSSIAHARVLGIHQSFLDRKLEPRLVMIGNQLWNDCTCWESNAINRPPNSPWMAGLLFFFLHYMFCCSCNQWPTDMICYIIPKSEKNPDRCEQWSGSLGCLDPGR